MSEREALEREFLTLANEHGVDEAERRLFEGLPPAAPETVALRRSLLARLFQDEEGVWALQPRPC